MSVAQICVVRDYHIHEGPELQGSVAETAFHKILSSQDGMVWGRLLQALEQW